MTRWLRFALLSGFVLQLHAADLQFDVASVKPNHSGTGHSRSNSANSAGTLIAENITLLSGVALAYNLKTWAVIGPDWLSSERYDISAKAGRALQPGEMSHMLQSLLAERFHLAVHRETRTLRGYALVATPMPKLKPATSDGTDSLNGNNGRYTAEHVTLAEFADELAARLDVPVRDNTGLPGHYNFTVDFSSELSSNPDRTGVSDGPSVFTALEQQLGLKLESVRAPFEVIVVDHADKLPVEN